MEKVALVAGATGLVGSKVVELLKVDRNYKAVHILVRKQSDSDNPKVLSHVVNFEDLRSYAAMFTGIDEIFCCLGTTMKKAGSEEAFYKVDFTYVYEIAKLGKAAGVKTFVLNSAMGADAKSAFYYNRVKGEIENKLRELAFEKLVIVRPSLLLGHRKEFRMGEEFGKVMAYVMRPLFNSVLKKYKPVKDIAVASAMIQGAFKSPAGVTVIENVNI
jgi:uncharacterized protein YbjT (DUF2867 family)